MKLILVVPCYNEESRINSSEFLSFISRNKDCSILFVDDGSNDNTFQLLTKITKNSNQLDVYRLSSNQGKANAVRLGIKKSLDLQPDYIGYWDVDLANPLSESISLVNEFRPYTWAVISSRVAHLGSHIHRGIIRHYSGRIFATLASLTINMKVYDTQCGAKIFRSKIAEFIFKEEFISDWFFDVEILARIILLEGHRRAHVRVIEKPAKRWRDVKGSKIHASDFIKAPYELLRILYFYRIKPYFSQKN